MKLRRPIQRRRQRQRQRLSLIHHYSIFLHFRMYICRSQLCTPIHRVLCSPDGCPVSQARGQHFTKKHVYTSIRVWVTVPESSSQEAWPRIIKHCTPTTDKKETSDLLVALRLSRLGNIHTIQIPDVLRLLLAVLQVFADGLS